MALSTKYNPSEVEDKWYQSWLDKDLFSSKPNPDKESYSIVIPPPNVTGVLHMGHMLNNTIQDIIIRRARMLGYEACWVPGTDHASIATEAKVVAMLKERGISKEDISREEFLEYAIEWKNKYGGIILEQLKKLGASCDWNRTKFTMDDDLYKSVIKVFVDLHKKGKIYRGVRMVNWDPEGKTAISDDEVNHKEVPGKLYHIKYQIKGTDDFLTVATTRPETILADTAIAINPNDERHFGLKGKTAIIPFIGKEIPIIEDDYVSTEFGTGCLKVTPAHDPNDYEIGLRHKLEVIDIIDDNGKINEKAGLYIGKDRFVVRKEIAKDLKAIGQLEKVEDYMHSVGFSERTDAVIEPKLSIQWFMQMEEAAKPALDAVMNDQVKLFPTHFKNTYKYWMENVRDWCISRQLWWGQRIPAYFLPNGEFVVAETAEEALILAQAIDPTITADKLEQDPDVLDTWFSSWLWPISVFNGILEPENEDIKYYYPTNDLVTAPEILFFWVARMIIAGFEYRGEMPFENVYLTGIVRDKLRRKMSKSLGNSPDPLVLIKEYGADAVRVGMLYSSPAGNDLLFDISQVEQGRNFANKVWNAYRLITTWEISEDKPRPAAKQGVIWFENQLSITIAEINDHFEKFRISDALKSVYSLFWDQFSSRYLEIIKPPYGEKIDKTTLDATVEFWDRLLRLLHPFMPFLTEELWQEIKKRGGDQSVMIADWPEASSIDQTIESNGENAFDVISEIRSIRNSKSIPMKELLSLQISNKHEDIDQSFFPVMQRLANLDTISIVEEAPEKALSFRILKSEFFVPIEGGIDLEKEIADLETELTYNQGFLKSVAKKLSNERFVQNAPAQVVANEQKKMADTEAKIAAIEDSLAKLR